jgi:hypothetical protein
MLQSQIYPKWEQLSKKSFGRWRSLTSGAPFFLSDRSTHDETERRRSGRNSSAARRAERRSAQNRRRHQGLQRAATHPLDPRQVATRQSLPAGNHYLCPAVLLSQLNPSNIDVCDVPLSRDTSLFALGTQGRRLGSRATGRGFVRCESLARASLSTSPSIAPEVY